VGAAVLPVDIRLTASERAALFALAQPTISLGTDGLRRLEGMPAGDGIALVIATSGTSGHPRLVELTLGKPAGLVPDIAGPRVYAFAQLVRDYLRASCKRRLMVEVRIPGRAARAFRAGANLSPERTVGHRTWDDFLAERVSARA